MKFTRSLFIIASSLACSGCWDFLEPDFPEAGAPAVVQASVFLYDNGRLNVNGLLVPGLAIGGVQRRVINDTLQVFGVKIAPVQIQRNGSRSYNIDTTVPAGISFASPFDPIAPVVEEVASPPPRVRWFGIRRTDLDTIAWQRGTDLILHVSAPLGQSTPTPMQRQWVISIVGATSFRASADSVPPTTIRIPTEWVPAAVNGRVTVYFSFYQAAKVESPLKDYIALFDFTTVTQWTIKVAQ
jgi:hypothetical protein